MQGTWYICMMRSLEIDLKKEGLIEPFNANVEDLMKRGGDSVG